MTFRLTVDSNVDEVSRALRRIWRDQIPFALSKAINETALDFQKRQRRHQRRVFTLRRPRFFKRAVKIRRGDFARKNDPVAIVRIEPPGGQDRADILTKFEEGGFKLPRGTRIAVPVDVKRTGTGIVSPSMRPSRLGFEFHGRGPKAEVFKGEKRTFMLRRPGGRGAVFRRMGRRGSGRLRHLFSFTPRARIRGVLDFRLNAERTVRDRFAPNFRESFRRAIETAR